LVRYKKAGGMIELAKLIESSAEPKKSQLLKMVKEEDPQFAKQLEAKILTFAKLKKLPESYVAEIVSATPAKHLALALSGEDEEFRALCEKCLGNNFSDYRQEKESLAATPPTPAQIESGRMKMLSEARKLEGNGAIKIEAALAGAPVTGDALRSATNAHSSEAPEAALKGLAAAEESPQDGPPTVDKFKMEAPPPGLIGERLETFIKNTLGS
jgi:hypothetical protein